MKKTEKHILACLLMLFVMIPPVHSEIINVENARTMAQNWISLIIHVKGDWGGAASAEISELLEFEYEGRVVGYFCQIKPRGHIIISLHKSLAPVKAYSTTCNLDPKADGGLTDLLKIKMNGLIKAIEKDFGSIDSVQDKDLETIIEFDYSDTWEFLLEEPETFKNELPLNTDKINYQEGEILLTSSWHQERPYNDFCPDKGCSTGPCTPNANAIVGCVATAAAQIMRYWNWPPYGVGSPYDDPYDWPNMPDSFLGCAWIPAEINAVAEICRETGNAVSMDYGCTGSGAYREDVEGMFENKYRYSNDCYFIDRNDFTGSEWRTRIENDLNANRPIEYHVEGHAIVADGWSELTGIWQYHMNYGWGSAHNTWYTFDALHLGGLNVESMTRKIFPQNSLEGTAEGIYSKESFPYRYVDQDAEGNSATFEAGQHIQFLHNVVLKCISSDGGTIRFEGSDTDNTLLFSRGNETKGIQIGDGVVKLHQNGGIVFR